MSLILEALRKSEAERQRGRMPDLHAELPPAPTRTAATPWRWQLAFPAVALLALAAWLATSAWRSHATTDATTPPITAATRPSSPALPRVTHLQPMAQPTSTRMVSEASTSTRPYAAATTIAPAHTAMATHDADVLDAADATAAAAAPANPPAPTPAVQPVAASTQVPSTRDADIAPLQLVDLSPQERKALPPLRLSMHLWNDDPSRRFVILDGNRLGEGDRLGNLVVTAIVHDGVLLDWNGRALKVPLR